MLPVIRHRAGKIVAVVLALAGWLSGGYWCQVHLWEQRIWWHLSGIAIFFVLAVFLPEERKARSLGRKGALQMMAFVLWLLATDLVVHFKDLQRAPEALALLLGAPLLTYFVCLFMIRGFRAVPEYGPEPEAKLEPEAKASEPEAEKKTEPANQEPVSAISDDESRETGSMGRLEESAAGESK